MSGRDRAKARGGERDELMPPRIPKLRPAMAHSTSGPSPYSATFISIPFTGSVRKRNSNGHI